MNEQELVTLCKNGDRKAFETLYKRYAGWMLGISIRYVGDEESSQDILHDCFVKIIESMNRFEYRDIGSLKAWLSRIVVNMALTHLQKYSNISSLDDPDVSIPDEELNNDNDEIIALCDAVPDRTIIEYVGKLPERMRVVFNLFMFENVSHRDIAERLGITESATRVRLHRAKALLAGWLKEYIKMQEQ